MQQDRGGKESDQGMKHNNEQQNQRPKALTTVETQQQQQQQPPQKCPRCDSFNTKFCYYNNYSLEQPRYLCKTCRRYWTQGGTLRNVPVGGGSRKGKHAKISSSGEDSRPTHAPVLVPPQQTALTPLNVTMISSNPMIRTNATFETKESGGLASSSAISSIGSYCPSDGFLSSFASIHSMNQPQPQPSNQLSISGGSSNLGPFQGYGVPSFGSHQHHSVQVQQTQFFPMGDRDQKTYINMYPSDQERLIQSSRLAAANSSQHNWHHHRGFTDNSDPTVTEAAMWSINNNNNKNNSSTSSADKTNTSNTVGGSLNPNQWPHLPGYGAPP